MRKTAKDKNGEEYDVGVIVCMARYWLRPEVEAARQRLKARGFLEPYQEDAEWAKTIAMAKAVVAEHDKDYDNLGNYLGGDMDWKENRLSVDGHPLFEIYRPYGPYFKTAEERDAARPLAWFITDLRTGEDVTVPKDKEDVTGQKDKKPRRLKFESEESAKAEAEKPSSLRCRNISSVGRAVNDPMSKHFHFDLKFGLEDPGTSLDAAATRRLAELLRKLDRDAPASSDVFPDGIVAFWWRKPPQEEKIVEAIKTLKIDFRYRFVGQGRDHKVKDCDHCDEPGPYQFGGICPVVAREDDWKTVRIT